MQRGMGKVLKDRLETLVKDSGRAPREISLKATGKPDTIRDILRGKVNNPRTDTVAKLAKELGAQTAYLTGESGSRKRKKGSDELLLAARVIGLVQAGTFMEPDADGKFEADPQWIPSVRDDEYPQIEPIAYEVAGDSIDKVCVAGGYVVCLPFADTGLALKAGMWVVVSRMRGGLLERTIKQVQLDRGRFTLHPASTNPKHKPIAFPSAEPSEEVSVTAIVRRFVSPTLRW